MNRLDTGEPFWTLDLIADLWCSVETLDSGKFEASIGGDIDRKNLGSFKKVTEAQKECLKHACELFSIARDEVAFMHDAVK